MHCQSRPRRSTASAVVVGKIQPARFRRVFLFSSQNFRSIMSHYAHPEVLVISTGGGRLPEGSPPGPRKSAAVDHVVERQRHRPAKPGTRVQFPPWSFGSRYFDPPTRAGDDLRQDVAGLSFQSRRRATIGSARDRNRFAPLLPHPSIRCFDAVGEFRRIHER
jgi:hypothetical protein